MTLFWLAIAAVSILCGLALRYIPIVRCWVSGHETVATIVHTPYKHVRQWCQVCNRDQHE